MTGMTADPPDHYATLGVADTAPHLVVQQAYRALMRRAHPDVAGPGSASAHPEAAEINAAWSVLKDPARRAAYDRARAARRQRTGPGGVPGPTAVQTAFQTAGTVRSTVSPDAAEGTPSWGPGGIRPVTLEQLREAAARHSAYGRIGAETRLAFSRASLRVGWLVIGVGAIVLALVLRA